MEILRHYKTPNAIGIALGVYNGPFFGAQLSQIPDFKDPMEPYIPDHSLGTTVLHLTNLAG